MNVVKKSFGRVFIKKAPGVYKFVNSMGVGPLDRSLGEVAAIEIPDENEYDRFVEIASTNGADSRWTSSLTSFLPRDMYSPLEELATSKCEFSMQIHYGECSKPNNFSAFDSAIVLNNVKLTNYGLSDLIARSPDQRGIVEESASISAATMYRILPQKFTQTAQTKLNNTIVSNPIHVKESACVNLSGQCQSGCGFYVMAFSNNSGNRGFIYTGDGGITWAIQNISGINIDNGSLNAQRFYLFFDGSDFIIVMEARISGVTYTLIYRMPVSQLGEISATATNVISVSPTISLRGAAMGSRYIFMGGGSAKAQIWTFDLSTNTLNLLYEDATVPGFMSTIAVANDDNVIAFNAGNKFIISNTYGLFNSGEILDVNPTKYSSAFLNDGSIVLSSQDGIRISHDNGYSWNLVSANTTSFPSSLRFYDNLVGYLFTSNGLFRTIDGGYTWTLAYNLPSTSLGPNRRLALCPNNPNLVMGVSGQLSIGNSQNAVIFGK